MSYLGDFVGTETINCIFTTVQSTGAPTTLAGTPKLRCYKNGSTTESSDLTPTVDFDARTGLNLVAIDLTGDSGFYATGNDFTVVITAGTVNSVSVVGYVVGEFSILHRSALRPATAGRTLVVDAAGLADANVVKLGPTGSGTAQTARDVGASVLLSAGSGTGQLDFTSGVVKANLAQILGTALTETVGGYLTAAFKKLFDVTTPVLTATSVNQTGDNYARLGAPAGASVSADVAAVKTDSAAVKVQTDKLAFTVANKVDANVYTWNGTAVAAPATAGVPEVNVKNMNNVSAAAITTIKAIQGLTTADQVTTAVNLTTNNDKTGYALTAGERTSIADATLDRDMSTGTDSGSTTVRTMRQALRFLRNKWAIVAGTLTVYKEDDATSSWTAAVATTAGNPVSSADPAGP